MSTKVARDAWASMHAIFMEGEAHDRVHRICAELGLSPPLLKAFVHLGAIADDEALRMSDLAEHWGCDASYVTTLADGLEERGLAERRPYPTDRARPHHRAHAGGTRRAGAGARAAGRAPVGVRGAHRSASSGSCATCWGRSRRPIPGWHRSRRLIVA